MIVLLAFVRNLTPEAVVMSRTKVVNKVVQALALLVVESLHVALKLVGALRNPRKQNSVRHLLSFLLIPRHTLALKTHKQKSVHYLPLLHQYF